MCVCVQISILFSVLFQVDLQALEEQVAEKKRINEQEKRENDAFGKIYSQYKLHT